MRHSIFTSPYSAGNRKCWIFHSQTGLFPDGKSNTQALQYIKSLIIHRSWWHGRREYIYNIVDALVCWYFVERAIVICRRVFYSIIYLYSYFYSFVSFISVHLYCVVFPRLKKFKPIYKNQVHQPWGHEGLSLRHTLLLCHDARRRRPKYKGPSLALPIVTLWC